MLSKERRKGQNQNLIYRNESSGRIEKKNGVIKEEKPEKGERMEKWERK